MTESEEQSAAARSRGWAETGLFPAVGISSTSGSRPPSGHHTQNAPPLGQSGQLSQQQVFSGNRRRSTPGSAGEECATTLPSIPSTPRDQHQQQQQQLAASISAVVKSSEGGSKMKQFEQNLEKFIKAGVADGRGRSHETSGIKEMRSSSATSSSRTPRGEKGRKKIQAENSASALSAAYGVSPYLQELKVPKKKMLLPELSCEERTRPEAEHRKKYIKMLRAMEEEAKRVKEEAEKKLVQQQASAAKLRAKIGVENVAPRLFEPTKSRAADDEEEASKKKGGTEAEELAPTTEEEDAEKLAAKKAASKKARELNKALVERTQKMLTQLTEKRQQVDADEEEKARREAKVREKLRKAAMDAAERAREEGEGEGAEGGGQVRARRRDAAAEDEEGPPSPKRGEMEKAIRERTRRYQERFSSEAEEEAWLRKKYGFSETDKLFNIAGSATSYDGVRQALVARGWREHREEDSMIFDLKWTIKTSDIAFKALNKEQLVNHFARNGNLTTKVGLTRNLRNLKWFEDVDMDQFFPRSYDLKDPDELCDFVEDFKMCASEITLKLFMRDGAGMKDPQGRTVGADNYCTCVQLALLVLDAHIKKCNVFDIDDDECTQVRLSAIEWTLILGEMCPTLHRDREFANAASNESATAAAGTGTHWNAAAQLKRQRTVGYTPLGYGVGTTGGGGVGAGKGVLTQEEYDEAVKEVFKARKFKKVGDEQLKSRAAKLLGELKEMNTQSALNGCDNVWIVKPAGKSRGRDIVCIRSINRLLEYIGYGVAGKEMQWVVQKYMERPYLINKRKFDFRQWVMVTDWNPLMVWFYDECYLRFSCSDFSLANIEDNLVHLCNNSIQKEQDNFEALSNDSMWTLAQFLEHLGKSHADGAELWTQKILPQMHNISKWALMCAQDMLENRKNSCEVYGYDLMLDEDLNIWLLEVNASPDMSASTHVTERLTQRVMDDMIKVTVDAREFNWGRKKNDKLCDVPTGGWQLIHRGEAEVSFPISAFGCKLSLTGEAIEIPKVFMGCAPTYDKKGSKRETRSDKLREEQKKKEEDKLKEDERRREEKKAQLKAELKKKKKEEKRRQREAARNAAGSGGAEEEETGLEARAMREELQGWGDDDEPLASAAILQGDEATHGAASAATLRPASSDSGSENKNENKDEAKDRKERKPATNWALKASEKVRDNAAMREKLHPRNASQRQLLPSKKVLATTVVTLGDCFGDSLSFPFA